MLARSPCAGPSVGFSLYNGTTNNRDVAAGNIILVINATPASAVTGNAGGTSPGSTDPNANYSY
ncbi:hypothetical protein BH11PLA1_BH11PLA1_19350 [soil metagenome]